MMIGQTNATCDNGVEEVIVPLELYDTPLHIELDTDTMPTGYTSTSILTVFKLPTSSQHRALRYDAENKAIQDVTWITRANSQEVIQTITTNAYKYMGNPSGFEDFVGLKVSNIVNGTMNLVFVTGSNHYVQIVANVENHITTLVSSCYLFYLSSSPRVVINSNFDWKSGIATPTRGQPNTSPILVKELEYVPTNVLLTLL